MAILGFEAAHAKLPTGGEGTDWQSKSSRFSTQSLFTYLLPFIEKVDVYGSMDLTKSYRDAGGASQNVAAAKTSIPIYVCPSNPFSQQRDPAGFGGVDYFATAWTDIDPVTGIRNRATRAEGALTTQDGSNNSVNGTVDGASPMGVGLSAVVDGASNTLAVIEDAGRLSPASVGAPYYTSSAFFDTFTGTLERRRHYRPAERRSPGNHWQSAGRLAVGRSRCRRQRDLRARPMHVARWPTMAATWAK